jgi:hypothetical protein
MKARRALVILALAVVAFAAAVAVTRALSGENSVDAVPRRPAARTSLPGLTPATREPELASLRTLHPAPGTVAEAAGPFDDRFEFRGLAFGADRVRGSVQVTSDVSDLLELEVVAGFYDARGRMLGIGRYVHHLDEGSATAHDDTGPPSETEGFQIPVPAPLRGSAVSAAVGVVVLVNE